jgi:hypothetical protein
VKEIIRPEGDNVPFTCPYCSKTLLGAKKAHDHVPSCQLKHRRREEQTDVVEVEGQARDPVDVYIREPSALLRPPLPSKFTLHLYQDELRLITIHYTDFPLAYNPKIAEIVCVEHGYIVSKWDAHLKSRRHHGYGSSNASDLETFANWLSQFHENFPDATKKELIARGGPLPEPIEGLAIAKRVWVCNHEQANALKVFKTKKYFLQHLKNCEYARPAEIAPSEHWAQTLRSNRNVAEWFLVEK